MSHQNISRETGDAIPKRRPECNMRAHDLRLRESRRESILAAPAWQQNRQRHVVCRPLQRLGPSTCLYGHIHGNWKVPQSFPVHSLQYVPSLFPCVFLSYWRCVFPHGCATFSSTETPDSVSVSHVDNLSVVVEKRQFQLQCDVIGVAPVQHLTVRWYQGNRTVLSAGKGDFSFWTITCRYLSKTILKDEYFVFNQSR